MFIYYIPDGVDMEVVDNINTRHFPLMMKAKKNLKKYLNKKQRMNGQVQHPLKEKQKNMYHKLK